MNRRSETPSPREPASEWLEISIAIDEVAHDALGSFLFDMGCTGIVTSDEGGQTLKAYLPLSQVLEDTRQDIAQFLKTLPAIFSLQAPPVLRFSKLADQDWHVAWRRFFRPTRVSPDLLVLPEWEPISHDISGHVIRMDPGPAFGTGYHATTRMCLRAMEAVIPDGPWTMLDVGTGSGILALYAAMLGARKIVAIDNDPEALRWAQRNIRLNGLSDAIHTTSTPVEKLHGQFSVVCANLILEEINRLLPAISARTALKGWMILSGILRDQVSTVIKRVEALGIQRWDTLHEGEWACLMIQSMGAHA
ncbi:MAG: 50S ribosomal protein L11 methyltransferase [Deltaproteobacteria bacterium]